MLKAREVWDEQEERRQNRMAAMVPVMAQIQSKIRTQAIHNPNAPYIVFEVPTYVFGYPLFSLSEAMEFLMTSYSKAGYWIWIIENKYLMIFIHNFLKLYDFQPEKMREIQSSEKKKKTK